MSENFQSPGFFGKIIASSVWAAERCAELAQVPRNFSCNGLLLRALVQEIVKSVSAVPLTDTDDPYVTG
jgi:hypothetical protein